MRLVVGLGNPGKRYQKTRHNLGFAVLDALARKWKVAWEPDKKTKSLKAQKIIEGKKVILVKPQTFMNASGFAVQKLITNYQLPITHLWVVHDDVDLSLGKMKIKLGGGSAGHRGAGSIIEQLRSEQFVRFRLGIGHPGRGKDGLVERYVLQEFNIKEKTEVKKMVKKAVAAIELALTKGLEKAKSEYNTPK